MDRCKFLRNIGSAAAASIAGASTLSAKADALEEAMSDELDKRIATPWMCSIAPRLSRFSETIVPGISTMIRGYHKCLLNRPFGIILN